MDDEFEELETRNRRLVEQTQRLQERLDRLEEPSRTRRQVVRLLLAVMLAALVLLSMYPVALKYAQNIYNPTNFPSDYQKVNDYLAKQGKDTRIAWLPVFAGSDYVHDWSGKRIGMSEVWSSNPSLNDYNMPPGSSYCFFLERELYQKLASYNVSLAYKEDVLKKDLSSRLLAPFAAKYLVVDESVKGYDLKGRFDSDPSLELVLQTDRLKVFRLKDAHEAVWAASPTVKAESYYDELSMMQKLPSSTFMNTTFINGPYNIRGPNTPTNIRSYQHTIIHNGDFEAELFNGGIPGWIQANVPGVDFKASYDSKQRFQGKRSLKVVNTTSTGWGLGWLAGTELPAAPGKMYSIETHVKCSNAVFSAVVVEGYEDASNSWKSLVQCPGLLSGDSGWQTWNSSFVLPAGFSKIRPSLAAGSVADPTKGPAITWFDSINLSLVDDALFARLEESPPPPAITFAKESAEKYVVKIENAKNSFMLVVGETYSSKWTARTSDGKNIDSVPLYNWINGFPVDKKGSYQITIEYQPQRWRNLGLVISLLALSLFLFYVLIWPILARLDVGRMIRYQLSKFWAFVKMPRSDW